MAFDPDVVGGSGQFTAAIRTTFPRTQALDLAGLIGRANSASYVPTSAAASARLRTSLTGLHQRHADRDGVVIMRYETEVFLSRRL